MKTDFQRWLLLLPLVSKAGAFMAGSLSTRQAVVLSNEESLSTLHGSGGLFGDETRREGDSRSSQADVASNGRFATGDELKRLRSDLESLRENLKWAKAMNDQERADDLSKAVKNGENRDPDVVYKRALREIIDAKASYFLPEDERKRRVKKWEEEASEARRSIARFHLEGLWVGNYGDSGQELINVTYSGDTLMAAKVTGDTNVPRGKISFTAELSPTNSSSLDPLKVSFDNEATQLMRYPGKGQVAQPGFVNSKYVEGQLVMFDKHFSFVWIPTKHHVLFRRPTPEQTLRLLRDTIAQEDEVENMRAHLTRCFDMDMTDSLARLHALRGKQEPLRRISLNSELQEDGMPLPAKDSSNARFSFWQVNKWREYIDKVIGDPDSAK
mmetsp:Transcript_9207/g.25490  ORF Transcript_9207/g.25490 Transcript_9207/m.25490 type:complete len:385 (-) Transcript_9207:9662-10816(-)